MKNLMTVLTLVIALTTSCKKSESSDSPKSDIKEERLHKTKEQDAVDMASYRNYLSIEFPESLTESIKFMIDDVKKRDALPDTISEGLVSWNYNSMYAAINYCEHDGKPSSLSITYYGDEGYIYIDDMGADSFSGVRNSDIFYSPNNRWSPNRPPYTKEEIVMINETYKIILLKVYAEFNYPEW